MSNYCTSSWCHVDILQLQLLHVTMYDHNNYYNIALLVFLGIQLYSLAICMVDGWISFWTTCNHASLIAIVQLHEVTVSCATSCVSIYSYIQAIYMYSHAATIRILSSCSGSCSIPIICITRVYCTYIAACLC